jgi:hypothetical protein
MRANLESYLAGDITREHLITEIISSTTLDEFVNRLLNDDHHHRYIIFGDECAHRESYTDESDRCKFDACVDMFCTDFKIYLEQALRHGVVQIDGNLMPFESQFTIDTSVPARKMLQKIGKHDGYCVTDREIHKFAAAVACTAGNIIAFVYAIDKYHLAKQKYISKASEI